LKARRDSTNERKHSSIQILLYGLRPGFSDVDHAELPLHNAMTLATAWRGVWQSWKQYFSATPEDAWQSGTQMASQILLSARVSWLRRRSSGLISRNSSFSIISQRMFSSSGSEEINHEFSEQAL
jgi:hypothetical protein